MSAEDPASKEVKGVVVVATEVTADDKKQGQLCCGCCCDFRRAVIVISIIEIVLYSIYTVLAATGTGLAAGLIEDDELRDEATAGAGLMALWFAFGIGFGVFQLLAAKWYKVAMLSVCLVLQLIGIAGSVFYSFTSVPEPRDDYMTSVVINVIISIVIGVLLYIYPTAMLIKEINAGTMSEKTYPREAHSCCCDPKV